MIILALIVFGLCLGSFVNALVWRLYIQANSKKRKKDKNISILHGRSMCPECKHTLQTEDLVPVISWLALDGKCRYCKKSISWQYPAVELGTAGLFVLSYLYWPYELVGLEIGALGLWLAALVGLIALLVYDLRWMLLPNRIIFPLYIVAAVFVALRSLEASSVQPLLGALYGVIIGGGIFYVLFQLSEGRWIGGGDVKLGFLLGAFVGGPTLAVLMLFIASLLGTLVSLPMLASKKASRSTRIPFGPFLIVSAVIVQLFGHELVGWYTDTFLY